MMVGEIVLSIEKLQQRMVELCNDLQTLKEEVKKPRLDKLGAKEKRLDAIRATIDAHFQGERDE